MVRGSRSGNSTLAAVVRRLERQYGSPHFEREDPLESLIGTILSQNTSDVNSGRAYDAMVRAFPTWADVMNAKVRDLEKVLRPGGLAKTKGRRIQKILRSISVRGGLNLDFLEGLPDSDAERALVSFEGVGLKTARCVLLFALGRDVFPIDTHIERILKRLGIIPANMTVTQAHAYVPPLIPRGACLSLHLNLIFHGRAVCHSRNPECGKCLLRGCCMCPGTDGTYGTNGTNGTNVKGVKVGKGGKGRRVP